MPNGSRGYLGGYYQAKYERFNRIYSVDGVSPAIAARCDRFSSFWIMESDNRDWIG